MKALRIIPFLFRDIIWLNLFFSLIIGYFYTQYGAYFTPVVFWIKLITWTLTWLAVFGKRSTKIYFYHNLGYTKFQVVSIFLATDLLFTIPLLIAIDGLT